MSDPRPLTPEEVAELAKTIHSWDSETYKKAMLDPEAAKAVNNVLDEQQRLREQEEL
jgi:hypothetical protein